MNLFSNIFGRGGGDDDEEGKRSTGREKGGDLAEPLRTNKYFDEMVNTPAPELVQNFANTAPPEVQSAVKATIVSLFGSLPPGQFESSIVSTSSNMASLMYSMMMTGYMFRNAEYRMSLKRSLKRTTNMLPGEKPASSAASSDADSMFRDTMPKVSGKVVVDMGGSNKVEVDAAAYVSDLHKEVSRLKAELARAETALAKAPEQDGKGELLAYMQSLPQEAVRELTSTVSPEVLECMQMLIEAVLSRDAPMPMGGESVVAGTGMKMRELLVWQLISGYRLRELEQRQELNKLFTKS